MKLRTLLKMAHEDTNITFDYYKNEIDKFKIIQSELSRKEKKSKQVPLTEEQVEILYKLKLSGIEEEVRDVFVCQCLLGQRIGDMPRLFRGDYTIIRYFFKLLTAPSYPRPFFSAYLESITVPTSSIFILTLLSFILGLIYRFNI